MNEVVKVHVRIQSIRLSPLLPPYGGSFFFWWIFARVVGGGNCCRVLCYTRFHGPAPPLPQNEAELTSHLNCVDVGSYCFDLFCTLSNVTETECSNYSFCSLGVLHLQGRAWVLQGKKIKKMHLMFSVKEWYKCTGRKEQVNRYVQWTRLVYEFLQILTYQGFLTLLLPRKCYCFHECIWPLNVSWESRPSLNCSELLNYPKSYFLGLT